MIATLTVPADLTAEEAIAGSLIVSRVGVHTVMALAKTSDFYFGLPRAVVAAAVDLGETKLDPTAEIDYFASTIGYPANELERLRGLAVFVSDGSAWARRVARAAAERGLMRASADSYNAVGAGGLTEAQVDELICAIERYRSSGRAVEGRANTVVNGEALGRFTRHREMAA